MTTPAIENPRPLTTQQPEAQADAVSDSPNQAAQLQDTDAEALHQHSPPGSPQPDPSNLSNFFGALLFAAAVLSVVFLVLFCILWIDLVL